MKTRLGKILLVGLALVLAAVSHVAAVPFDDEPVVLPRTAVVGTASPAGEVASACVEPVADVATGATLWKELGRLYGEAAKIRRWGKRFPDRLEGTKAEHHLKGYDDLDISIDGDNYCGQFAMSTLLNGMGIETDPQEVYKKTNPAGIFTSPPTIVEFLRQSGIDAKMKNEARISDITKRIDGGRPVMCLVDSGDGTPHWICITGYDTDASGKVVSVRMRDSYWGDSGPHTMPIKEFETAWKKPFGKGPLGSLLTYSNLLIDNGGTCEPTSTPLYPGTFSTATEDNMASGINDVVTGWKNRSYGQVAGGAFKLLAGLPSAITGVASNFLANQSRNWTDWGKDKWQEGGFGNRLLGGAAVIGGGVTNVVAKAGQTVSNVVSSGVSIVGNGIKKIGSWFS